MNKKLEEIEAYMESETYFELDYDDEDTLYYISRENGDVGSEEPGDEDFREAYRLRTLLSKEFNRLDIEIKECDEWVHLNISL